MEYTVREFRNNLREALDIATNEDVFVNRFNKVYVIKLSNDNKELKRQLKETLDIDVCQHGFAPILCKFRECRLNA